MTAFFIMDETRQQVRQMLHFKGDTSKRHTCDFSSWADDNGDVTAVVWTIESGQASISSEALANNVATIRVTTSEAGNSMLKAIASNANQSEAVYARLRAKDPQTIEAIEDYGLVRW